MEHLVEHLAPPGEHPEVAIGIPRIVVTAKPGFQKKYADQVNYRGPLTMSEAVETGLFSLEEARRLIGRWKADTGQKFRGGLCTEILPYGEEPPENS